VTGQLPTISCPALIISADDDYWPVAEKEAYTAQIPNARLLVVEDSRHATPVDQPEVFNTAVLDFLQGVSRNEKIRGDL
jgi:pimeloyl-ACP methyl ester carboxylesterase